MPVFNECEIAYALLEDKRQTTGRCSRQLGQQPVIGLPGKDVDRSVLFDKHASLFSAADEQDCLIVGLFAKGLCSGDNVVAYGCEILSGHLREECGDAVTSELFLPGVGSFEDAVGGDGKEIALFSLQGVGDICVDREQADGELIEGERLHGPAGCLVIENRWVSGEGVLDAAIGCKADGGESCVHVRFLDRRECAVETVAETGEEEGGIITGFEQDGADGGFDHAHEDAGLESVTGNISDIGKDGSIGEQDYVHQVAAHFFAGQREAIEVIAAE